MFLLSKQCLLDSLSPKSYLVISYRSNNTRSLDCISPLTLYKDSHIVASDWSIGSYVGNGCPTGIVPGIIDIGCAYCESAKCPSKLGGVTTSLVVLHCTDVHPWNFLSHFCVVVPPSDGWDGKARDVASQENQSLKISDILSHGSLQDLGTNYKKRKT